MSFIERTPRWLRWTALPLASAITYLLVNFVVAIVGSLFDFVSRGPYGSNFTTYILAPGFAGYWCIAALAIIAPAGRRLVALVATGCWMFVYGAAMFFALMKPGWATFLPIVFSVVGSSYALIAHEEVG